jgi:hypothetical protein
MDLAFVSKCSDWFDSSPWTLDHCRRCCARKRRRALPGETILVAAALLGRNHQSDRYRCRWSGGRDRRDHRRWDRIHGRAPLGTPFLRKYGRYISLDENRLLIGRYLFFRYGNSVVFFGRFVAVLRMFAALLAGANSIPAGRFFFFNVIGGICWACLFGFGAHALGTEIFKISKALSLVSLGLFYCRWIRAFDRPSAI